MQGVAPGDWAPGKCASATAVRLSLKKIRITIKGETPRWGYDVDLVQHSGASYELRWRSGSCVKQRNVPKPYERAWEFTGNFRRLRTLRIATADGDIRVDLSARK